MILTPDTSDCLHLYLLQGYRYAHAYYYNQKLLVMSFGSTLLYSQEYPNDALNAIDVFSFRFQLDMEPVKEWNRTVGYVNRMTIYDKPYIRYNTKQQVWNMVVCFFVATNHS